MIGFGWIGAGVQRSHRWCDRHNEGLRWCDRMGFLGLTNGFGHCSTNELGLGFSGFVGVGFWVRSLLPLSLSLSLRAGVISLSLSSLSVFRKMIFEGKIKTEINLHPNTGQLKSIFGKCIFHAQPNTRKYGKAFPEVIFTQNKHNLSFICGFV